MKVLILGGTGAMGLHLIHQLASRGVEITVTSRQKRNIEGKVSYIKGNALDIVFIKSILTTQWDAIVDFMVYSTSAFEDRVDLLLEATKQYIYMSSARVYAGSANAIKETSLRLLDTSEDDEFLSTDEYSLAKARQENILRASSRENWTIIRPYITYSEIRLQLGVLEKEEWLYRALQGRTIVFPKDISLNQTTMTYGKDVSDGIAALVGNTKALSESFHITANKPYLWRDILNIYLGSLEDHLGYRPKVTFQDLDTFLSHKPALYQVKYDRLFDRRFDNSKIAQHIDINGFMPLSFGLVACLSAFIKHPKFGPINWATEALRDKQTNECASLKEIGGFKNKKTYLIYRYDIKNFKIIKLLWKSYIQLKKMFK